MRGWLGLGAGDRGFFRGRWGWFMAEGYFEADFAVGFVAGFAAGFGLIEDEWGWIAAGVAGVGEVRINWQS